MTWRLTRRDQQPPETHDLQRTDYAFTPRNGGREGSISCWSGRKPQPGDYLILKNGAHGSRYRVETMDPCWNVDPATMWIARLTFAPRPPFDPEEKQ